MSDETVIHSGAGLDFEGRRWEVGQSVVWKRVVMTPTPAKIVGLRMSWNGVVCGLILSAEGVQVSKQCRLYGVGPNRCRPVTDDRAEASGAC